MNVANPCSWETFAWPSSTRLIVGSVVAGGAVSYLAYRFISARLRPPRVTYPPDVVTLYKIGPSLTTPGISPFSTKLETYLRLAKIPYKAVCGMDYSSQGKMPWISHLGREIPDSQFCIEYLAETFNVHLNKALSDTEQAVSRAMRSMAEDSFYWYLVIDRWKYQSNPKWITDLGFPSYMAAFGKRRSTQLADGHGSGRRAKEDVYKIALGDARALSIQLGNKPFMFGDVPVEEDCAIFGQLTSIYYSMYGGVVSTYVRDKLPNLVEYLERMKALAWPDWEQCLRKE